MTRKLNGQQHVDLARKEYDPLKPKQIVKIDDDTIKIGEVSQVFDKPTGEQSFVITDHYVSPNASLAERETVKEVTVLYRGSTAPSVDNLFDPKNPTFWDVRADWVMNDIPTALQILSNGGAATMPQLQSSADTLQKTMRTYPNALVSVYGHSLGAMDGQYAISDLPEEFHERVDGVYVYQGPNIYNILNKHQQKNADKLTNAGKIFNFIDTKDLVPIGYSEHKKQVGTLIEVESKKVGIVDQHMWGGYQFDKDGNILSRSTGKAQLAKDFILNSSKCFPSDISEKTLIIFSYSNIPSELTILDLQNTVPWKLSSEIYNLLNIESIDAHVKLRYLSDGQKQKVKLYVLLSLDKDIVIFDELQML